MGILVHFLCADGGIEWIDWMAFTVAIRGGAEKQSIENWQTLTAPRARAGQPYSPEDAVRAEPLMLIVVPTRELATQIFDEARRLCYRSMLRPCVAYGGGPSREQMELRKGCDVLIAITSLSLAKQMRWSVRLGGRYEGGHRRRYIYRMFGDSNDDDDHFYMMFSATFPMEAKGLL